MKKRSRFFSILCLCALLVSCKKNANEIGIPEQSSKLKGDKEFKKCQITKIVGFNYDNPPRTFEFEYNAKGDPLKITPSNVGTAFPIQVFRYDKKGRLTDRIGVYTGFTSFEYWQRFVHDNKNRIVQAFNYIFGIYGEDPSGDYVVFRSVVTYEYDSEDRVVKTTQVFTHAPIPSQVENFVYDSNGNLVKPGVVYDDKINYQRTNNIWMFLERDYSVNNGWPVDAYNSLGLPTMLNTEIFNSFLSSIVPLSIEYDCKGDPVN